VFITEQETMELASARMLILQRSFVWNRMISDLEQLVPHQARISAIKVEGVSESEGGMARLQVKAVGGTAAQMTEMMTNVEQSGGLFATSQADQDAVTETGEIPFTLQLTYKPARGRAQ
jgi:Tfp pilus assembly protein PilN